MSYAGSDCLNREVVSECIRLVDAITNFQPYPHEKKIRLAVSYHVQLPLNVTLQRADCYISCKGGTLNSCNTSVKDYYWENVSSPFYFLNCTSGYHYCVTATIGDCCPICTKTIYMPDYHTGTFVATNGVPWRFTMGVIAVLLVLICFGALIIKHYVAGQQMLRTKLRGFEEQVDTPLRQESYDVEKWNNKISVLLLYARNEKQAVLNDISYLQLFLRSRRLKVIDIYNEEETIVLSVHNWVQTVMKDPNMKIVILDTDLFQQLWNYELVKWRTMRPVDQAISNIRSCIFPLDVPSRLYIVRLEIAWTNSNVFNALGNGRSYSYPSNRERLLKDLTVIRS